MPLYKFLVASPEGNLTESLIEGESEQEALRKLSAKKVTPIKCLGLSDGNKKVAFKFKKAGFDVLEFTERLVPLLLADIPLEKALKIVEESSEKAEVQLLIEELRQGLHEGASFSKLLRDRPYHFPKFFSNLVEVGEKSGNLAIVMEQARTYLKEKRELKSFIVTSSIYPVIILSVSVLVMLFLLGFVVPRMGTIFKNSNKQPPFITEILLNSAYFVQNYWWLIALLIVGTLSGAYYAFKNEDYRNKIDQKLLSFPLFGQLILFSNISAFSRTMTVLLKSGVHLLDAVKISTNAINNHEIKSSVSSVAERLTRGVKLSSSLQESQYLPKLFINMLKVGEEIGDIEGMMNRVADTYDAEVRQRVKQILALFEPLVMLILGAAVAFIVVSMFLSLSEVTTL